MPSTEHCFWDRPDMDLLSYCCVTFIITLRKTPVGDGRGRAKQDSIRVRSHLSETALWILKRKKEQIWISSDSSASSIHLMDLEGRGEGGRGDTHAARFRARLHCNFWITSTGTHTHTHTCQLKQQAAVSDGAVSGTHLQQTL